MAWLNISRAMGICCPAGFPAQGLRFLGYRRRCAFGLTVAAEVSVNPRASVRTPAGLPGRTGRRCADDWGDGSRELEGCRAGGADEDCPLVRGCGPRPGAS